MKNMDLSILENYYKNHIEKPIGRYRYYSVLIPFVEKKGNLYLLLELRAKDMDDAPGEICFPGGRVESGEDAKTAALRETEEELGIPRDNIRILGTGDTLYAFSGVVIFTVPGIVHLDDYLKASLNPKEVAEAILVPLEFFLENEPVVITSKLEADRSNFPWDLAGIDESYPWSTGTAEVPIYKALPDGKIVWGMTANIIRHFIMDLKNYEF